MKNTISYLIKKLAGAGFSLSIFFLFMLSTSNIDMYRFSKDISNPLLWLAFFGYGFICSIIIDFILSKFSQNNLSTKVILYVVAGFSIFIIFGFNLFTIIAGTIGAIAALLFYFGTVIANQKSVIKYIFAFVMPILFLIIMNIDFTVKKQWSEVKKETSYSASFDYFNGEQQIPIKAKEGQTISFSIEMNNDNGGGHGHHILNEKGKLVPMIESTEKNMKFSVEKTGVYRVVVTGDDLKGSFSVDWKIEDL
ncbi:hypothetical protein KHA93_14355 [Bacillus sp. FJAT-49732]|uniref:Uncharacterized protein n=1 Tax=Lederbergia citrisecunda TaxID=2833583 RepID=A0A942TRB0_9BACI|nr:hypothetical protein [Lederbergia citrisecunda]MBS4200814.1 hypothetical protein [Lederbergia citrisecunda]